jgi:inner membrane protein
MLGGDPAWAVRERTMKVSWNHKALALVVVAAALWIALDRVSAIVAEREARLREAENSVAMSLAAQQQVVGPVLQRACEESWQTVVGEGKDRKTVTERREFKLMATPTSLDVSGRVTLEPRYRGLYKVNGYVLSATGRALWQGLDGRLQPRAEHSPSVLRCQDPVLFVEVADVRGLRSVALQTPAAVLAVQPGTPRTKPASGFEAALPAHAWADGTLAIEMKLELVGTRALSFAPVAEQTQVSLASDWPHPSFQGRFLPNERSTAVNGFTAAWRISSLATSAPRDVRVDGQPVESFGVEFIDPVNAYLLADRATKYGVLFIGLTFLGVAFTEVMRRARVHPVQYLLVGSALAVFFLLLVSLSEHMPFAWAYAAAAASCTALLAFYGVHVLGGVRGGLGFGAAVAVLYGVLYLLLQQEQTALVLGACLLFAALAAVMVLTRRFDWYRLFEQWRAAAAVASA